MTLSRIPAAAALCVATACLAGPACAAGGAGSAGGILARMPLGARIVGLGGPQGGLPASPSSMLANPAALGVVDSWSVEAAYDQGIADVEYNGLVAAGNPLPWLSAGLALQTLTSGEVETYDYVGTRFAAPLESDRLLAGGVAARTGPLCAGASLKYLGSTLLGAYKSSAVLADLGARLRVDLSQPEWYDENTAPGEGPNWLALSFSAANLGQSMEYGGASDPSPLTWSAGAVVSQALSRRGRLLTCFAGDVTRESARPEGRIGFEASWPVSIVGVAVRAGARMKRDGGALSGGLGASIRGISLDYAYLGAVGPFAATHHFTLGFSLGAFRRTVPPKVAGD